MVFYIVYGRKNNQIKIRGNRVELDEINSIVLSEKDIKNAYSIFYDNSICLFICANQKVNVEYIKKLLKEKLPSYMLPNNIVQLHEMPVKANGKIDINVLENIFNNTKEKTNIDVYELFHIITCDTNQSYDDYKLEMFGIDSLNTLKLIQILSETIEYRKMEFSDTLLKNIVTMKISNIRDFIKNWVK